MSMNITAIMNMTATLQSVSMLLPFKFQTSSITKVNKMLLSHVQGFLDNN